MEDVESDSIKGFITEWLICGPFPRIGPFPNGRDSFYIDFLKDAGGEEKIVPKIGLTHPSSCVDSGYVSWRKYVAGSNGYIDFVKIFGEKFVDFWNLRGGVVYAYTTIRCEKPSRAVFLVGSEDSIMVWLNGKLVHHNNVGRTRSPGQDMFVADLQKGVNRILVKVARYAGGWGFYLQIYDAKKKVFVNKDKAIMPDLRIGEKVRGWGCIPVLNVSKNRINKICIRVLENDLFNPSLVEFDGLSPGEWRRIPFWISMKRELNEDDSVELKILIEIDEEEIEEILKPRVRRKDEWFISTYRSRVDGSIQPYGLLVPTSYDPERKYPLIVILHGYKAGWAIGAYALKEWCIMVGVYGRGEVPYREIGEIDVFEVIEDVKKRYNIDEDRIYLTGHSMGGGGTWYIGLHRPDYWAGIAPLSAGSDYRLRMNRLAGAEERILEYLSKLIDERNPIYLAENALNLPIFVSHGSNDRIVSVEHSRRIVGKLRKLGYKVEYEEVKGKGHVWGSHNKPWWGREFLDRPIITNFFHKHRRHKYPRKVYYKTNSLRFNKAYWIEIDEMNRIYETAYIIAEVVDENVIDVKTKNIVEYKLKLCEELGIDMSKSLTIISNGFKIFLENIPRNGEIIVRTIYDRDNIIGYMVLLDPDSRLWIKFDKNGSMETLYIPLEKYVLRKRKDLFGPIIDAFNSPFLLIYGSNGSGEENEANREAAYSIATWWKSYANGDCKIKADINVSVQDILKYNLILFGNHRTNILMAKINNKLPIKLINRGVKVGSKQFIGEDIGLIMIYPNPLNPNRYVLLNASIIHEGMYNIKKLYSRWVILPDYVIFKNDFIERGWKAYLAAGFFNKYWEL